MNMADIMAFPMIVSALTDKPYSYMQMLPKSYKQHSGSLVTCRICHHSRTTLFRDAQGRICKKCRDKIQEQQHEKS